MAQSESLKEKGEIGVARFVTPWVVVAALAASVVVAFAQLVPPTQVPADAPASEFSASRAAKDLEEIARKPHPVGSSEHQRVRDYILGQLSAMGLNPRVRKSSVLRQTGRNSLSGASVENISANIAGTDNNGTVLLVAHYDSVQTSPGASDNSSGVATLFETARALKAGHPLRNAIVLLFTDAEEIGLLGAKAFVDEDPAAKDVSVVLNFDARGVSGPSIMFETSSGNGWLIKEFARAAPYPIANSLTSEVYKHMPNDNDLSVFKRAGLAGLNFAYIEGLSNYHTAADNVEHVEPRSLQHHGSYALALARHFGDLSIGQNRTSDQIYFSVIGTIFVHYSIAFALILAAGDFLLFLFVANIGFKNKLISTAGVLKGLAAFVVSLGICGGAVAAVWQLLKLLHGQFKLMPNRTPYSGELFFLGFVALTLAIMTALCVFLSKRIGAQNLILGTLSGWLILTVLVTLMAPTASYPFAWPLFFSLISAAVLLKERDKTRTPLAHAAVISVLAVPVIILFVPIIYLLFVSLGLEMVWAVAASEVLLLSLLIPHILVLARSKKWLVPGTAAILAIGFLLAASLTPGVDRHHPKADSIFYALNAQSGKAAWASYDERSDEWTSQFLGAAAARGSLSEYFATNSTAFLRNEAPVIALKPPILTVIADTTQNSVRTLHLRLASMRQAAIISASVDSASGTVTLVNGKQVNASLDTGWGIRYYGAGDDGIDFVLELNSAAPITIKILDMTYQLPELEGLNFKPRPDYIIPAQLPLSDSTLVSYSFIF